MPSVYNKLGRRLTQQEDKFNFGANMKQLEIDIAILYVECYDVRTFAAFR